MNTCEAQKDWVELCFGGKMAAVLGEEGAHEFCYSNWGGKLVWEGKQIWGTAAELRRRGWTNGLGD
jgi:hypothetical protein